MYILQNKGLRVSVLDPLTDRQRFGSRYCTGGYIWQISDLSLGDLLSGPRFPDQYPPVFDGQGVPEVFETALGQDRAGVNEEVLVIGVGRVVRTSPVYPFHVRDNPEVSDFCRWNVSQDQVLITMETSQCYGESSLNLVREVYLQDRVVISRSVLINTGKEVVPLRWFVHPFFPLTGDLICCKFPFDLRVPQNPGFVIDENQFLTMRSDYPWVKGLYCLLDLDWRKPMIVKQRHPLLFQIEIHLKFEVSRLPVWANANTFSFEPYLNTSVCCQDKIQWSVEYHF